MAKVITTNLYLDETNSATYCDPITLELQQSNYAFYLYLDGDKQGYAILNNAAKEILYPSNKARPFKAISTISASSSATIKWETALEINDIAICTETFTSISQTEKITEILDNNDLINSNRDSKVAYHIIGGYTTTSYRVGHVNLELFFNQYTHKAETAFQASGITSIEVSTPEPYAGDIVNYYAKVQRGWIFKGWYADYEHTELVSTSTSFKVEASSDLTLYAYAVRPTKIMYKEDNQCKDTYRIYRKQDGNWVEITKADLPLDKYYETNILVRKG